MAGFVPSTVEIEVDLNRGKPQCLIIGLANQAIAEAKERFTAALQNSGVRIKAQRTVINLAPADIKKTGSHFDLAMAVGLLQAYGEISLDEVKTLWLGELSLAGAVRAVRGLLPLVLAASDLGFARVVFPAEQLNEVELVTKVELCPVQTLSEVLQLKRPQNRLAVVPAGAFVSQVETTINFTPDFNQVAGQAQAKRAFEIAAAGGHNLLLVGPPGSGKSALAKAMPSILPSLSRAEVIEISKLHSLTRILSEGLVRQPPFRSPHHSISYAGLLGGGRNLSPGEISLAHGGVLFLDELLEFRRDLLEGLRQPLEDRRVTIVRIDGRVTYPAAFSLVATTNPCPCGYFGVANQICQCSPTTLENYQRKLSGPILDRIDLQVRVEKVQNLKLAGSYEQHEESSASVRKRVTRARQRQLARYHHLPAQLNAQLTSTGAKKYCALDPETQNFYVQAAEKLNLSSRSYFKVLTVARTIADLAGVEQITLTHLAEALTTRLKW